MPSPEQLIAQLQLQPLPREGGWFARTRTGPPVTLPDGRRRPAETRIWYLLAGTEFSALHRLRSDEVWRFHAGGALDLLLLDPAAATGRRVRLGAPAAGVSPEIVVPAGVWQGAALAPGAGWALVECTMTPGWDDADFDLGEAAALARAFPAWTPAITALTRPG